MRAGDATWELAGAAGTRHVTSGGRATAAVLWELEASKFDHVERARPAAQDSLSLSIKTTKSLSGRLEEWHNMLKEIFYSGRDSTRCRVAARYHGLVRSTEGAVVPPSSWESPIARAFSAHAAAVGYASCSRAYGNIDG